MRGLENKSYEELPCLPLHFLQQVVSDLSGGRVENCYWSVLTHTLPVIFRRWLRR